MIRCHFLFVCYIFCQCSYAQIKKIPIKNVLNKSSQNKTSPQASNTGSNKDSTPVKTSPSVTDNLIQSGNTLLGQNTANNTDQETLSNGIREMLTTASDRTVKKLGKTDGFLLDNTIKIDMPSDVGNVTSLLKKFGMGKLVDDAVLSMNRGAETATAVCFEELSSAIKKMTIQDARSILFSKDTAATAYMRSTCESSLYVRIKPIVEQSLEKVNATKYWNDVFSNYNKLSRNKVNSDLSEYVNGKVLYALFMKIGQEEMRIRENPGDNAGKLLNQLLKRH